MRLILDHLRKYIQLSEEEENHLIGLLEVRELEKKQFLQQAGEPCGSIHFVNEGILRSFFLSEDGKDSTLMFATQNWWITDMDQFLNARPALVSIQAVTEASVLSLSKAKLDRLYDEVPVFNKFFRILMQNAYCREQRRSLQTLALSAKERYEQFNLKYPEVARQVTQKQIASYLGITPEFLSYLRAQKD